MGKNLQNLQNQSNCFKNTKQDEKSARSMIFTSMHTSEKKNLERSLESDVLLRVRLYGISEHIL